MFNTENFAFCLFLIIATASSGGEEIVNLTVLGRASPKQQEELQKELLKRTRLATNGKQRFSLLPKGAYPTLVSPKYPLCLSSHYVRDAAMAISKEALLEKLKGTSDFVLTNGWAGFDGGRGWSKARTDELWPLDAGGGFQSKLEFFNSMGGPTFVGKAAYAYGYKGLYRGKTLITPIRNKQGSFYRDDNECLLVVDTAPVRFFRLTEDTVSELKSVPKAIAVPRALVRLKDGTLVSASSKLEIVGKGTKSPELTKRWEKVQTTLKEYERIETIAGSAFSNSLLLLKKNFDRSNETTQLAVFDNTCTLTMIEVAEERLKTNIAAKEVNGELYLLFFREGFCKLKGNRLKWIDKSNYMRMMDRYLGMDKNGRHVFHRDKGIWLFTPEQSTFTDLPVPETVKNHYHNCLDSTGHLWIVGRELKKAVEGGRPLPEVKPVTLDWQTNPIPSASEYAREHVFKRSPDGNYFKVLSGKFSGPPLSGKDGAIFLLGADEDMVLVHKGKAWYASSADAFIARNYELVLKLAPDLGSGLKRSYGIYSVGNYLLFNIGRPKLYKMAKEHPLTDELRKYDSRQSVEAIYGPFGKDDRSFLFAAGHHFPSSRWLELEKDGTITFSKCEIDANLTVDRQYNQKTRSLLFNGYMKAHLLKGKGDYTTFPDQDLVPLLSGHGLFVSKCVVGRNLGYAVVTPKSFRVLNESLYHEYNLLARDGGEVLNVGPEGIQWLRVDPNGLVVTEEARAYLPYPVELYMGKCGEATVIQGVDTLYIIPTKKTKP